MDFCSPNIDPLQPTLNNILGFLTELFNKGLQYRSISLAKSALNTLLKICSNMDITKFEEINRFLKGVYLERPPIPRYNSTWDVNLVLTYLKGLEDLTLFQLSCKLSVLFLLVSAQRCQFLHLVEIDDIIITKDKLVIHPNHLLKQSRPGFKPETISLDAYPSERNLCIVQCFHEYIQRTNGLRTCNRLLISTIKPHKAISKSTLSRWVKFILLKAGVGEKFGPHSTRSASTSHALLAGVDLNSIVKTAGWSNATTFHKFYNKPVIQRKSIQQAVLSNS
jgi:integrase